MNRPLDTKATKAARKRHAAGVARLNEIFGYDKPQENDPFPGRADRRAAGKRQRRTRRAQHALAAVTRRKRQRKNARGAA